MPGRLGGLASLLIAGLAAVSVGSQALGQGGPADAGTVGEAGEISPSVLERDEVELRVVKLGPGGRTRAGDWGGVLVEFRDSALEEREILIRLTGFDRDGDLPQYDRVVVGDPERARGVWMYGLLPYADAAGRVAITAHEALEAEGEAVESGTGFRAGRILGRTWIDTRALVEPESGLIGVIGTRDVGLRQYGVMLQSAGRGLPLGHEHTEVASGLTLEDIPDRWQGLASYGVLVWSRGGAEADPTALGTERARAITDWVSRGGHLVVMLPPVGQEWTVAARNPLSAVLPAMTVERREGVSLEAFRPLLTFSADAPLPGSSVVHVMRPSAGAPAIEAMSVIAGPPGFADDGGAVVMRRAVGTGMVTVVGLDLTAGNLSGTGVLDAEVFWHRILGKRHRLDTFEEVRERDQDLSTALQQRAVADYDTDFEREIDRTGDSATGVLLSLAVFGLYWLIAGPLGFAVLTKTGRRGQAWVGFVLAGAVFTALAWVGASLLRPKRVEATHLVFLDGVHGTGTQSGKGWMSVLVPSYGEATIAVGGDEPGDDLIAPWTPPPPLGGGGGFPDNRGYPISSRRPNSLTVPVRSTIKQVRVDWSGNGAWRLPEPAGEPGELEEPGLRLVDRDEGIVEGDLIHALPRALEDVVVVVVAEPASLGGSMGPLWMPGRVFMDVPSLDAWAPGTRLDLRAVTGSGQRTRMERSALGWFQRVVRIGVGRGLSAEGVLAEADPPERFAALTFFDMISAPDFKQYRSQLGRPAPLAARREGHGLDLSRWLTQPCVIVIGHVVQDEAGPGPVPVSVNGELVPSGGRTVVRWVYPLASSPPRYPSEDAGLPVLDRPGPGAVGAGGAG